MSDPHTDNPAAESAVKTEPGKNVENGHARYEAIPGHPHIKPPGVPQAQTKILSAESVAEIQRKMVRYPVRKSAVLPALTVAYRQIGYLNDDIYEELSQITEIPKLHIAEAASFYTLFPKKPRGKYLIMVCDNISCALCGADSLIKYLEEKLQIRLGETTPDNLFTLQSAECLAGCSAAPMMQVNHAYYENLTRKKIDELIETWRREG